MIHRHQVAICLAGLALGAVVGLLVPSVSGPAAAAIDPLLVTLLYATFFGIPFGRIGRALRDGRFLAAVFVVNFVVVPVVAFALSRIVADDQALLVGVLFVLLAPCVDYVIVFSSLAGGATDRLLAAAPLLMLVQMVALPAYLWLFVGSDVASTIDAGPFVRAFVLIVVAPMVLAGLTQGPRRALGGVAAWSTSSPKRWCRSWHRLSPWWWPHRSPMSGTSSRR
ncbi:bile acid:sodium symporter [Gordonia zhenghanii]|uniref:bile acid:sodium symporter n=1 Tax=Gordonia zhenghanii TaxID=2911516 RepID=UPI0027DF1161|nr:bile acid:sodium symporter [Gordonia zhenghanii]